MSNNRRYPMNHAAFGNDADPADKDPREMDFSFIDRLSEESSKMLEEIEQMLSKYQREPGSDEGHTTPTADPCADNAEQEPDPDMPWDLADEVAELMDSILYGGPDFEDEDEELCERPLYAAPDMDAYGRNASDRSDRDDRTSGDDDDFIIYY